MVCVATSDLPGIFLLGQVAFSEFVIQVPNPTQEMDFNFFAGCSLGGYLISSNAAGLVWIAAYFDYLFKNYDYDFVFFYEMRQESISNFMGFVSK